MAAKAVTTLSMTGPFFQHDPKKTFRQNIRVAMKAVAEEAAKDIIAQMEADAGGRKPISGRGGIRVNRATGRARVRGQGGADPSVAGHRVSEFVEAYTTGVRSGHPWQVTSRVHIRNKGLTIQGGISLHAAASRLEGRLHMFRKTTNRMRRAKAINQAELLKGLQ